MQSQRFGRSAGDVQGRLETVGALQRRLKVSLAKGNSFCSGGAALLLSEFLDGGFQFPLCNLRVERRGPVVALPGFDVININFDRFEFSVVKPDRRPAWHDLINRRHREYSRA